MSSEGKCSEFDAAAAAASAAEAVCETETGH